MEANIIFPNVPEEKLDAMQRVRSPGYVPGLLRILYLHCTVCQHIWFVVSIAYGQIHNIMGRPTEDLLGSFPISVEN